ncbi:hypothetical protein [Lonepinella sp. MS14437]|uniref:hypothetical protein n=2 Tax=unclassified Lonepinella TaxID=2642006 RepID=UPI0036DB667F
MKWLTLKDSKIDEFMALLSDEALLYVETILDSYDIVRSPFSIEINSFTSLQCIVKGNIAYILSFNYGRFSNINTGISVREINFIQLLKEKYFSSNQFIHLSVKQKRRLNKLLKK